MFYSPFSSGYSSFQDPSARGRTMRRAEPARTTWGQPAISPYNSYDSYLPGSRYVVDDAYPYSPSYDREDLRRRQMMMRQQEIDRKQALMDAQERAAEESMSHSLRSSPSLRQTSPHKSRRQSPYPTKKHEVPITSTNSAEPQPATASPTPRQIEAASKIQAFYRSRLARRMALSTISDISTRFNAIKSTFHPPSKVDYRTDGSTLVTIPVHYPFDQFDSPSPTPNVPKLAYTSTNKPIHAYTEDLNRLLSALDAIESGGDNLVREKRKQLAQAVESEAQRLDKWVSAVWEAAHSQESRS